MSASFDLGTSDPTLTYSNTPSVPLTVFNGTGSGTDHFAYSNLSSTIKFYFETIIDFLPGGFSTGVGCSDPSFAAAGFQGSDAHSFAYYDTGAFYINGGGAGAPSSYVQGDNVGFAVDVANLMVWVRVNGLLWNNDALANPITNTNGLSLSSMSSPFKVAVDLRAVPSSGVTAKFAASSWSYTKPTGFEELGFVSSAVNLLGATRVLRI